MKQELFFNASDAPYGATTSFDLSLYDIQTFTVLKCSAFTTVSVVVGTKVRGLNSGAIGYAAKAGGATGREEICLSQTTGSFIVGEKLIFNEKTSTGAPSIKEIIAYTVDDIKSIFQNTFGTTGISTFNADTVLFDRILPYFSASDQINAVGTAITSANRSFSGRVGIKTDSIISFSDGSHSTPVFNKVSAISADGKTLTVAATTSVTGVNVGPTVPTNKTISSTFRNKVPKVLNLEKSGIFSKLPRKNISNLDTSDSNLIIQRQIRNQSVSSNSNTYITSRFRCNSWYYKCIFWTIWCWRYSITYQDGGTEPLTSDQVTISDNAELLLLVD